jgi:hypothetical protein
MAAPWPRDPDGAPLYPGTARALAPEERTRLLQSGVPYALRLDMAAACARAGDLSWVERGEGPKGETGIVTADPTAWGDIIIARKQMPTSYHLSVVVDDALQGITEVVLGDQRASAVAAASRAGPAHLPASPSHSRRGWAKTVEIDQSNRPSRIAGNGHDPGRYSPPGRSCLRDFVRCQHSVRRQFALRRDSIHPAVPC